jgi:hypothetical protein
VFPAGARVYIRAPDQNATTAGPKESEKKSLSFGDGFVSSLMMIILAELGDKTFFIAAVSTRVLVAHPLFSCSQFTKRIRHGLWCEENSQEA